MATIEHMEVHVCGKCGCESWMLRTFLNDKRKTREDFYCPNGHCRAFVKSTEEILAAISLTHQPKPGKMEVL